MTSTLGQNTKFCPFFVLGSQIRSIYLCCRPWTMGANSGYWEAKLIQFKMLDEQQIWMAIPRPELENIIREIQEIKALFINSQEEDYLNRWVESEEARKQLGVSPKTWQKMRDNRAIAFTQFGRKIFVRQADIESFFRKNLIASRND